MMEYELRRMGVTEILHMQIPYGHAHIDGNLNFASHEVAAIHPAQVPIRCMRRSEEEGL